MSDRRDNMATRHFQSFVTQSCEHTPTKNDDSRLLIPLTIFHSPSLVIETNRVLETLEIHFIQSL